MNINICNDCVKEIHLKQLIDSGGTKDVCSFCDKVGKIYNCEDEKFYDLLKSLIRFYYNEWEYNSHWGGESLYQLIEDEDLFFNRGNFSDQEGIEFLTELMDTFEPYEDYSKGISLYAGYDQDGNQNPLLRALKDEIDPGLNSIIYKLKSQNYFDLEEAIIKSLNIFLEKATTKIEIGKIYFRARIGYAKKDYDYLDADMGGKYIYFPYLEKEIANPPPFISQAGRLNRAGVSFLYCSTNEKTAISEVRPHPGDKVSIGCFKNIIELKLFNLSKDYLLDFYGTDKLLDDFLYINSLNILYQKTVPPSKKENYSITQIVTDCIRKLGFDGILFNSSVADGNNIVVFNGTKMKYTEDNKKVVVVKKVDYDYEELK